MEYRRCLVAPRPGRLVISVAKDQPVGHEAHLHRAAHPLRSSLQATGFEHELLEYRGISDGTRLVGDRVRVALRAGAPVLVVAPATTLDALRGHLDVHSDRRLQDHVYFLDLNVSYRNPALLAQVLIDFVDAHPDGPAPVGICEIAHGGRDPDELIECELHDSVLGLLFDGVRPWHLTCLIDLDDLSSSAVERQRLLHGPHAAEVAERARTTPLAEPSPAPATYPFNSDTAREARGWAVERGRAEGLTGKALETLEIVAGELTINSISHGGSTGTVRVWSTPSTVVCEVADHGQFVDPLAGRRRPTALQIGGRGLWIINQFCALQQVRSTPSGTVVRAHISSSPQTPKMPEHETGV